MKNFFLYTILLLTLAVIETLWVTRMISQLAERHIDPLDPLWLFIVYAALNWTYVFDFKLKNNIIIAYRFNQVCWVILLQASIWSYRLYH